MQCFILVVCREISHQFLYKHEPIDEYVYSEKSMQVTTRIYPVVISTKLTPKGVHVMKQIFTLVLDQRLEQWTYN